MAVFHIEKTRDYTVMSNHHLRNTNLSLKAKGLLSLMLSLPENWDYTTKGLARICKDGVDSICAGVRELEEQGYVIRERVRNPNGQLGAIEYTILEQPRPPEREKPERENPVLDNPILGSPVLEEPEQENPTQLNTKKSSKETSKTDLSSTEISNPIQSNPQPLTGLSPTGAGMGTDGMGAREIYREIILDNIGYEYLIQDSHNWKRSLKAAFYTAIEDDCIRKNPFNFALDTVLEDDTEAKIALTQEQEDSLLAFAAADPVYRKYCDEIIILLGTGLRVSELCGLTVDLDFANRQINVDHQLLKDSETGYYVDAPKTKNGIRQIPMSDKVYEALKRAVKNRGKAAAVDIDGYKNFLFLNQSGYPKTASSYESMFKGLVKKYNKQHKLEEALPNITPHTMRHTFCTRLANAGMNPKALQYIMGHSNITMTLNYYAHATYASAKAEMDRLAA